MSQVDELQPRLDLRVIRDPVPSVSMSVIERQPTLSAAVKLCIQASGLSHDQVRNELEIDAGQFSRILSGGAHFPNDKLCLLMDICGNEVPLIWLAHYRGYRLERLQSKVEAGLARERDRTAELEMKLRHMQEFLQMAKG